MEENQNKNKLNNENKVEESAQNNVNPRNATKNWGAMFGIFMVVIYFGMAYLTLCTNYFFWMPEWSRYGLGTIFVVYGLWRGYRYFKNK